MEDEEEARMITLRWGLEKYVVKMGGNRNDSNDTFGMSVRGVQSAIFTARVALEFKASLISKLGMKL